MAPPTLVAQLQHGARIDQNRASAFAVEPELVSMPSLVAQASEALATHGLRRMDQMRAETVVISPANARTVAASTTNRGLSFSYRRRPEFTFCFGVVKRYLAHDRASVAGRLCLRLGAEDLLGPGGFVVGLARQVIDPLVTPIAVSPDRALPHDSWRFGGQRGSAGRRRRLRGRVSIPRQVAEVFRLKVQRSLDAGIWVGQIPIAPNAPNAFALRGRSAFCICSVAVS